MAEKNVFTEKLGPLEVWVWMALVTALGLLYYLVERNKKPTSTSSSSSQLQTTPAAQVPQFVIQNMMPTQAPLTSGTAPASGSGAFSTYTIANFERSGAGLYPRKTGNKPIQGRTGGVFQYVTNPQNANSLVAAGQQLYYMAEPGDFVPATTKAPYGTNGAPTAIYTKLPPSS